MKPITLHDPILEPASITDIEFRVPMEDIFLELDSEGLAAQADIAWIDDQYNAGAFTDYEGEHVAVVGKKLLGHHKRLKTLREEVSQSSGYPLSRIVISYIDRSTD